MTKRTFVPPSVLGQSLSTASTTLALARSPESVHAAEHLRADHAPRIAARGVAPAPRRPVSFVQRRRHK